MTSTAGTLAVIFAAIAGFWLFDSLLERMDRVETQAEARRWFGEGQALRRRGGTQKRWSGSEAPWPSRGTIGITTLPWRMLCLP